MRNITRRGVFAGVAGVVGASAVSAWSRGAILPVAGNAWLKGIQLATDRTPYLNIHRVLRAQGGVTGVAWSQDGSRIAAISNFGQAVTVWDASGLRLAEFLGIRQSYVGNSIAFLSNDIVVTPAALRGKREEPIAFSLLSVQSQSVIQTVAGPNPGKSFTSSNQAQKFVLSPDAQTIAATTGGGSTVYFYSTDSWKVTKSIIVHDERSLDFAQDLSFSPDGKFLGAGLLKGVKLFDVAQLDAPAQEMEIYPEPRIQSVNAVTFSPDGTLLATGSGLNIGPPVANAGGPINEPPAVARAHAPLKIWRLREDTPLAIYTGHIAPIRQLCWDRTGRFVAAACGDDVVRLYAPNITDHEIAASQKYQFVMSVSFSPDAELLAAATGSSVTLFTVPSV